MSFSINTNVASLQSQGYLEQSQSFQNQTIAEVTSGLRIVNSGNDAAGLAIANGYRADEAVLTQGIQNANNGLAQLQIADGGLNNISQLLDRAQTLATQSASGTFTGDRTVLNSEFQSVVTEISRQAQAIGLNTGGVFATNLSVFIGGGKSSNGTSAISNGSESINLNQATVDAKSLGLEGVQAAGQAGTDIGTASATSVQNILANSANTGSESQAGYTTFNISGPGFSGANKVTVAVNLSGVTDANSLVTAVNAAIQAAGNGNSQYATAFHNANITAALNTDSTGKTQLSFSSANSAFQVQAGDQAANALLGNFSQNAALTGNAVTTATVDDTVASSTLSIKFNGASTATSIGLGSPSATDTLSSVVSQLNANASFSANAVAYVKGNQIVLQSKTNSSTSEINVQANALSAALGLTADATTNNDVKAAAATTGASVQSFATGGITGTGTTPTTATAFANNVVVHIQGGGLDTPVDLTLNSTIDTTLGQALQDLQNQVTSNKALQAAGITLQTPAAGSPLTFVSTTGQSLSVSDIGDTGNLLGLGTFLSNNTILPTFNYSTITGSATPAAATTAATDTLEISVAGGEAQQISATGAAGQTLQTLADQLNSAIQANTTLQSSGLFASVSGGALTIASSTGTDFRLADTAITADQILGFAGDGTGTFNNQTFFNSSNAQAVSAPSTVDNPLFDPQGATQTTSSTGATLGFTGINYGSDSQTVNVSAVDAGGATHSVAVVLNAGNAGTLDQALATINTELQKTNDPTLQQVAAVKEYDPTTGNYGLNFVSTLTNFNIGVGQTNSGAGITDTTGNQGTVVTGAQQGSGSTANISNISSAEAAVNAITNAVAKLGSAQAVVGRGENQFTYAVNLAQSQLTNETTAESNIRDADLATEAANLTKAQILIQAGVAALAQANAAPQQILALLKG